MAMSTIVIIAFLNDHSESPMPHLIQKNDSFIKKTDHIQPGEKHGIHKHSRNPRAAPAAEQ